jgi:16S rRNA (guanine1516-N2)-methyltransferase
MQVLQSLLGVDPDADRLLEPALAAAKQRVVVKRPAKAAYLAEKKPNMSMQSKKHRFDIYLK